MYDMRFIKSEREFKKQRAYIVGSSDVPVICGIRYYRNIGGKKYLITPKLLYREKKGLLPAWKGNENTAMGKLLEPVIIKRFVQGNGIKRHNYYLKTEFQHPDYPFVIVHPDVVVNSAGSWRIQEVKARGKEASIRRNDPDFGYDFDLEDESGIPLADYLQILYQMLGAGIGVDGVIAAGESVLINTATYREFDVKYNQAIVDRLLERADRFAWHLKNDREPDAETWTDIQLEFPEIQPKRVIVSGADFDRIKKAVDEKADISAQIKELEKRVKQLQDQVGLEIKDNNEIVDVAGGILARQYECSSGRRLDLDRLQKNNPALYEQVRGYIREGTKRTLKF